MKRKSFIRTSVLTFSGLTAVPLVVKALNFQSGSGTIRLYENIHIRHGNYGDECRINTIEHSKVRSIRYDRFRNPDGDMLHYEIQMTSGIVNLAIISSLLDLCVDGRIYEYDLTDLKGDFQEFKDFSITLGSLELSTNQLGLLPETGEVVKGPVQVSGFKRFMVRF